MLSHLNPGCQSASRELPHFSKWTHKWGKQKVLCDKSAAVLLKVRRSSITDAVQRLRTHSFTSGCFFVHFLTYWMEQRGRTLPSCCACLHALRLLHWVFCFQYWIHQTSKVQMCFSVRGTQLATVLLLFGSAPRLPPLTCLLSSTLSSRVSDWRHSCDGQELQRRHETLAAFHALDWAWIALPPLRCIIIQRQVNPGSTQNCERLWRSFLETQLTICCSYPFSRLTSIFL